MSPILEGAHAAGSYLSTSRFSILVRPGCDAYQASAVLLAGVAAFPARTRHKLIGAAVGTAALMVLNFLRLGALLWTGENHPEQFERMHIQVLPIVFVAAALGLLLSWALWARR
jgi:exosortase/archaeosortase family protein